MAALGLAHRLGAAASSSPACRPAAPAAPAAVPSAALVVSKRFAPSNHRTRSNLATCSAAFDPLRLPSQPGAHQHARHPRRRAAPPACRSSPSDVAAVPGNSNGGAGAAAPEGPMDTFKVVSDFITNLFPVWTVLAALLGLVHPTAFSFITVDMFTVGLSLLMFSMGITLTVNDFVRVFQKPGVVGLGFVVCYVAMPMLAYLLAMTFNLSPALLAGLVLVGSINGGQASNLCTYIARGDVALSVLMTTSTTIGTIFMTPLIAQLVLGTIVPVDARGIAISTIQVVLAPIIVGVSANKFAPKACKTIEPFCPIVGIIATVVLVGASVAKCAGPIIDAGIMLQLPVIMLHLLGGILGYWVNRMVGYNEKTCRTTAIETAMKSSAFGFLLASMHFGDFLVRVPSAVSVVWMAIMGSSMAVFWRFIPIKEEASKPATA